MSVVPLTLYVIPASHPCISAELMLRETSAGACRAGLPPDWIPTATPREASG
jgi:hypothetical protein